MLVPSVVVLTILAGGRVANAAEVVLSQVDADGPPLRVMLWPHESQYVITSQSPEAGALVRRYETVVVTFDKIESQGPDAAGVREPRRPSPSPGGVQVVRPPVEADIGPELDDR